MQGIEANAKLQRNIILTHRTDIGEGDTKAKEFSTMNEWRSRRGNNTRKNICTISK
jgi:hypothetical protein